MTHHASPGRRRGAVLAGAFILLVGSAVTAAPTPTPTPRADGSAGGSALHPHEAPARAGAIEGVVTRRARPQPRVVNRYPAGGAPAAALPLQDVPAVVYVAGPVAGAPRSAARSARIAQQDSAFIPTALVVPVGGTVEFPNLDPFFHNVFSASNPKRFNLGRYPQGETKVVDFDQPGVVKIYCEVHKHMRSAVVVVENPFHAVVGADGRFRIDGVPAGRYTLVIWHMDEDPEELQVDVPDGGVARVEVTLG